MLFDEITGDLQPGSYGACGFLMIKRYRITSDFQILIKLESHNIDVKYCIS